MSATICKLEYLRPAQVSTYFPLSRTLIYELIAEGKIKSKVIRRPGNIKGMRLILTESIRQFIESQPDKKTRE